MRSSIREYTLPFINLMLITIAVFFLYRDFTSMLVHTATRQIGTITFKKKVAERRYSAQVIWEGITNNSPVYNFDAIRTDKGSLAVINLSDGTSIELEEESMVILQESDKGLDINFEHGSINAQSSSSQKQLNIKSGNTVVAVSDGGVNLDKNRSDKSLSLNVTSGTAELIAAGKTSELDSSKSATIAAGAASISEKNIFLISPTPAKTIVSTEKTSVRFSWRTDTKAAQTLQVSQEKSFSSTIYSQVVSAKNETIILEEGIYYWRVSSDNGKSEIRRIAIVQETKPFMLRPIIGQIFSYRSEKPNITFKWNGATSAQLYTVQISPDSSMRNIVKSINSYESFISTNDLSAGTYYCRVRAAYTLPDGKREIYSSISPFTIEKASQLKAPKLYTPVDRSFPPDTTPLVFNWQSISDANRYRIKVKHSFSTIVTQEISSNMYSHRSKLAPGNYSWSIVALAADGSESSSSDDGNFKITSTAKLITLSPSIGEKFKTSKSINFSWKDENNGSRYLITIAKDSLFTNTYRERETSSRYTSFSGFESGSFYWKVYLLNAEGRRVISSNASSFSIAGDVTKPFLISPINKKYPHDTSTISFQWRPVSGATHYEIEIYKNSFPLASKLNRTITTATSYSFNISSYKVGEFYWRVRALEKSGSITLATSDFSKEYFSKLEKKQPPKKQRDIKITTPSKIYIE